MSTAVRPACILAALLLLAPVSAAQNTGRHRAPVERHKHLKRAADKLGLSDEQRDQIKAVAGQHADQMIELRRAAAAARENLRHVLDTTPQDADALRAAARAVSAANEELAVARGSRRAEARGVLTPEQQQQSAAHKAQRAADRELRKADRKAEKKAHAKPRKPEKKAVKHKQHKPKTLRGSKAPK